MRSRFIALSILLNVVAAFWADAAVSASQAGGAEHKYFPGRLVVKFKGPGSTGAMRAQNLTATIADIQARYAIQRADKAFDTQTLVKRLGVEELDRIYYMQVSTATDVEALARRVSRDPRVEFAEPDYIMPEDKIPDDPSYGSQYQLALVQAATAWDVTTGDSTVIIADIDTGVDWDHPDLAAAIWKNSGEIPGNGIDDDHNGYIDDVRGWDFVDGITAAAAGEDSSGADNDPMDFDGHGTHTAGICAAVTNNGTGIASLAWGAKIMPLRIGWRGNDGNGYGLTSWMSEAFVYAANNGASVANLSFGTDAVVLEGARYAYKNGVVLCNAAGNTYLEGVELLGAQPWALSVAATSSDDRKASYSSYGTDVDVCAPGGDVDQGNHQEILSTVVSPSAFYGGQLYAGMEGTSMASPMVASLAALIKSKHKDWTPARIMFQITGTADNIDALNSYYAGKLGYGRINAGRALTDSTLPAPRPAVKFVSVSVDDAVGGNGNGILEPGESANILLTLRNDWGDANALFGNLVSGNPAIVVTKAVSSYGNLPGISNIDSCTRSNVSDAFHVSVAPSALPVRVPFTVHLAAKNGYSDQFTFTLGVDSHILLVDDDEGFNAETYYEDALDKLGVSYDYWNHVTNGTPTAVTMSRYSTVIWLCEWAFPSLDSTDRANVKQYLDGGGNLFVSGQDIGWDLCDPGGGYANEFVVSGGDSKTFYEQYLKAHYVADDAGVDSLIGTKGDSVGDGIALNRFQPGRGSSDQYPDVVDTVDGSRSVLKYVGGTYDGKTGAVRYSGGFHLVYFSFGGFESIVDSTTRLETMRRVLSYLGGYTVSVDTIADTEDSSHPYAVGVHATARTAVLSSSVYWSTNAAPFTQASLASQGNGLFTGSIPAQSSGARVTYFVLVQTGGGYLPYSRHSFYVGPDTIPPVVCLADTIHSTLKLSGPYPLVARITDNLAVDTSNSFLHYSLNGGAELEAPIASTASADTFNASATFPASLATGDHIAYYLTVRDRAAAHNTTRVPASGSYGFDIGREMVDDFELDRSGRWDFGGWGYATRYRHGSRSITDSPSGAYAANADNSLTILKSYDLSPFSLAQLQFYYKIFVDPSDTVSIELTRDDSTWVSLERMNGIGSVFGDLTRSVVPLDGFVGPGNEHVRFRFRLRSDANLQADGIYVDDIQLLTGPFITGAKDEKEVIPAIFALDQNFPNPFNPMTTINYSIAKPGPVGLRVFDLLGRLVATLVNGRESAGFHRVMFNGSSLSSGAYYYVLSADGKTAVRGMMLMK